MNVILADPSPETGTMMRAWLGKYRTKEPPVAAKPDPSLESSPASCDRRPPQAPLPIEGKPMPDTKAEKRKAQTKALKRKKGRTFYPREYCGKISALKAQKGANEAYKKSSLFNKLVAHVVRGLKEKRLRNRALAELIAKVGTAPSAGGARAPIAGLISSVASSRCDQSLHTYRGYAESVRPLRI